MKAYDIWVCECGKIEPGPNSLAHGHCTKWGAHIKQPPRVQKRVIDVFDLSEHVSPRVYANILNSIQREMEDNEEC